jgi:serine/threonine-protein kinase
VISHAAVVGGRIHAAYGVDWQSVNSIGGKRTMSLQPGKQVKQYVMSGLIAKGGMGVVWRAWDGVRNEAVAIKAVANDLIADPEFKVRIQDEARRHQRLQHPNIVPVLDVFEAEGETCIVMQLIEGTSLDNVLESRSPHHADLPEATAIIRDLLVALDYAHRHGIVHRDVKPSNVLLDKDHRALLIDFGIALAMGEERRTRTGQIVGTPAYMSPEQITKPKSIDHRSDVYSVGCVFYEMLSGRPPFVKGLEGVGDTDFAIQHAHVTQKPLNLRSRVPSLPPAVDAVVMAALEKDPEQRIPGCQEFLRLLAEADTKPTSGEGRSFRVVWAIGVLVIVALILIWLIAS